MPSRRLLAVTFLAFVVWPQRASAQACEVTLNAEEQQVKSVLERVRNDPFAAGLTTFINELSRVDTDLDRWLQDANALKGPCERLEADQLSLNRDVASHNGRCSGTTSDPALVESCQQSANALNQRQAALDARGADLDSRNAALNVRGAAIGERATAAVNRGKEIINDSHVGEAFWLYAQRKSRDASAGNTTSCAAMVDMFSALGQKTSWDIDDIVTHTGQVLSNGVVLRARGIQVTLVPPGPRSGVLGFSATGFRPEYVDAISDNQVRHFVGYFAAGVRMPSAELAPILAEVRDANERGDYSLGVYASNLAARVKSNPRQLQGALGATCR